MLCILLALVFAGASLSSGLDRIQHAPGASTEHDHLIFSEMAVEQDHVDDHHDPAPDDDSPTKHLTGGHHHHGDSGAGMIVPASAGAMMPGLAHDSYAMEPDRQPPERKARGPERPPKTSTMNA